MKVDGIDVKSQAAKDRKEHFKLKPKDKFTIQERKLSRQKKSNKKSKNVLIHKNTSTPILPSTRVYIKSYGYFNKNEQILIEQISNNIFIFNYKGSKGLIKPAKIKGIDETGNSVKGFGFVIDDSLFLFQKPILPAENFYNVPSLNLCRDYLSGKYKPREFTPIWKDLDIILKTLFDFSKPLDVEVCKIFIGQTYLKPLLNEFFFLLIDATYGAGKTTLGEIIFSLSYHGFVGGDYSTAVISRLCDELDLNLYIDELDQALNDFEKVSILRKAQRRGNPYIRCEGRDNLPALYRIAGCHGGSYRSEMEDAFVSRSLRIHTSKSLDYRVPTLNSDKKMILKPIADELFLWSFENLLDLSVETCSKERGVEGKSKPKAFSRENLYNSMVKDLNTDEKALLRSTFGRDNELIFLCLKVGYLLQVDILTTLKEIIKYRQAEQQSGQNFYLDSLIQFLNQNFDNLEKKTLTDGLNSGKYFYPKSKLFSDFQIYLRSNNAAAIGTKKFASLLRDLGFIDGVSISSQRYFNYPCQCLIFTEEIKNKFLIIEPDLKQNATNKSDLKIQKGIGGNCDNCKDLSTLYYRDINEKMYCHACARKILEEENK